MKHLKVKLIHSGIGRSQKQKDTLRALGLRKLNQERVIIDSPPNRGMLTKVVHLVSWEHVSENTLQKPAKRQSFKLL